MPNQITDIKDKESTIVELSCIAKQALIEMNSAPINIAAGITTNPSDEKIVKTIIRALCKYEKQLDVTLIGLFLKEELNWNTRNIEKIQNLINTLNSGKYFHGGEKKGLQNYYKRWKKKCEEKPLKK